MKTTLKEAFQIVLDLARRMASTSAKPAATFPSKIPEKGSSAHSKQCRLHCRDFCNSNRGFGPDEKGYGPARIDAGNIFKEPFEASASPTCSTEDARP